VNWWSHVTLIARSIFYCAVLCIVPSQDIHLSVHLSYNGLLIWTYGFSRMSFRMILSDIEWVSKIFNHTKHRAVSLRQLSFLFWDTVYKAHECQCAGVIRQYSVKMVTHILKLFLQWGCHTILVFSGTNWYGNTPMGTPWMGALNARGYEKITIFDQYLALSRESCKIVTMEGELETAPNLSNCTSVNDLEWPLTRILRSKYYSTSNNSKMVLTMADQ